MEDRAVQSFEDVEVWRAARQVVNTVYALSREAGLAERQWMQHHPLQTYLFKLPIERGGHHGYSS